MRATVARDRNVLFETEMTLSRRRRVTIRGATHVVSADEKIENDVYTRADERVPRERVLTDAVIETIAIGGLVGENRKRSM